MSKNKKQKEITSMNKTLVNNKFDNLENKDQTKITTNKNIDLPVEQVFSSYNIKTFPNLNVRTGPSYNEKIVRVIPRKEEYTILEEKDGWGRIGKNEWILLSCTTK